jgi:hypothetical protein
MLADIKSPNEKLLETRKEILSLRSWVNYSYPLAAERGARSEENISVQLPRLQVRQLQRDQATQGLSIPRNRTRTRKRNVKPM